MGIVNVEELDEIDLTDQDNISRDIEMGEFYNLAAQSFGGTCGGLSVYVDEVTLGRHLGKPVRQEVGARVQSQRHQANPLVPDRSSPLGLVRKFGGRSKLPRLSRSDPVAASPFGALDRGVRRCTRDDRRDGEAGEREPIYFILFGVYIGWRASVWC